MKKILAFLLTALVAASTYAQSFTTIPDGLYWPWNFMYARVWAGGTATTLNGAGIQHASIGTASFVGSPSAAQSFGSTAKVGFFTGAVTFANAGTTINICIQGVASGAGPIAQPDGTCKGALRTLTGGTDTITANAYNEFTLSTSGASFNVTQGDLIAVVINMTARGGSDSVTIAPAAPLGASMLPLTNVYTGAAWQTTAANGAGQAPAVVITSSTPTLGTLAGTWDLGIGASTAWSSATNPNDRALIFQVPTTVKVDALYTRIRIVDANSDFTLALYSSCESNPPTTLASVAVAAENLGVTAEDGPVFVSLPSEITLSPGTDYCVGILATGSSNVRWIALSLGSADHRSFSPGGTSLRTVTRNDTGAFGSSSTTTMYPIGVRISKILQGGGGTIGGVF